MSGILEQLTNCIELGKINKASPYPPSLKGQDGADELCKLALDQGVPAQEVLNNALIPGMSRIGEKFSQGKAFVPEMLISAKAMTAAMKHLKPYFTFRRNKEKGSLRGRDCHGRSSRYREEHIIDDN